MILNLKFFLLLLGPEKSLNTPQEKSDPRVESANHQNSFKIGNYEISRKNAFFVLLTTLCTLIAILLLTVYLIYGDHLHKQETSLGDGDDSRKNIAINSTIG